MSSSKKRERDNDDASTEHGSPAATKGSDDASSGSTSNFRNVSACNRCRTRKNRCDQKLPRCSGCEKANVKCVGFDPVSKRAIPRSYVYYLETRVRNLEIILQAHGVPYPPPEDDFAISDDIKPGQNVPFPVLDEEPDLSSSVGVTSHPERGLDLDPALRDQNELQRLDKLANDVGLVSVQGNSTPKDLASTSGISFARVVFAAVKSSVPLTPSDKGGPRMSKLPSGEVAGGGGTSMRDSFFGLHSRPAVKPAPFPDREAGQRLVDLYFEFANPQIPILHRGEFKALFDRVYAADVKQRSARELYFLNIVFAIGSGIIMDSSNVEHDPEMETEPPSKKRQKTIRKRQPEEYHSSAVVHLETFLGSSPAGEGSAGGLEELQAVLLLAGLALLRPVPPGLWYIIGVAMRLAIDLGLHAEDVDFQLDSQAAYGDSEELKAVGRRQWTRDLRRRLWWCVYNLDRLVSTCVGRPVGITDQVVTTEFPSLLDDKYITTNGFLKPPVQKELPTYKLVALHYCRLRLLQSEILQVLQHRQALQAREMGANSGNDFILKDLSSPFLVRFNSFRDWRWDVDRRLREWKDSVPANSETGVSFTPLFFELNYWQAIILLYRQSLAVPEQLASEMSPSTGSDVHSPGRLNVELKEDEQMIYMKVAQSGQTVLKIYRQLHRLKLVNYTFLATHHLFMSGVSFLYAIWHSDLVRSELTLDDVDFTVLIATSVLSDLVEKCPPAEACRDAFVRMSKATIAMVEKTTGFGSASTLSSQPLHSPDGYFGGITRIQPASVENAKPKPSRRKMTMPKFDMNLKDLFTDEEIANRPLTHQPKLQGFGRTNQSGASSFNPNMPTDLASSSNPFDRTSPMAGIAASSDSDSLSLPLSNQQPYQPLAETISQSQPDFTFDDMSFLDTFPVADPNGGTWGGWNDLSFGTGGTSGYDSNGNGDWDPNGIDLFGGLFFGGDMSGYEL